MSSQTPNLNLVLPVGTEKVSRQIINDNNTKIDTAVGANSTAIAKVQNGLAFIVGNTNTTGSTLAVGQFIYVKGHSTIAEGLRKVTASISANGNITTSNTSECTEGGLNAINGQIANINKIEDKQITRIGSYFTERSSFKARRVGNTITIFSYINITTEVPANTEFANTNFSNSEGMFIFIGGNGTNPRVLICSGGKLKPTDAIPTGYYYCIGTALTVV